MEELKRIIVIDLLYLGDLLFAHPFFEGLRKLFPETRIDLVANSNFAEIMRINNNIDHVYSYNKNWTVARSYNFAKKLKMNNYQLGINIHGNWRTALLLKLISPLKSIGFGAKGRGLFLDEKVEKDISSHMIEFYLEFLGQILQSQLLEDHFSSQSKTEIFGEQNHKKAEPFLKINESYQQNTAAKLKTIGLESDFIVLNTGGSWKTKRWPEKYFIELADLLTKTGERILFVGGPSDSERVNNIFNQLENQDMIYNLCGETTLVELAALLKKAKLIISGDTGPVHVAASVGTNTVTIFGPSDEKKYAPRGRGKNIIIKNKGLECRPCGEHQCPLEHFKCMREISPEMIIAKIKNEGLIK